MAKLDDLGTAVLLNNTDTIKALIAEGVDVNGLINRNDERATPLVVAAIFNKFEAAQLLVEAGADVNLTSQPPTKPKEGWRYRLGSPLTHAAGRGNLKFVKMLVEHGADLAYCSPIDDSALHNAIFLCAGKEGVQVIHYLLDCGCDPFLTPSGRNLLYTAAYNKQARGVITELISRGAHPNAIDDKWMATPMQNAIEQGNERALQELLEHGADPELRWPKSDLPWSEMTAIEYAKKLRKRKILALLERADSSSAAAPSTSPAAKDKSAKLPPVAKLWEQLEGRLKASFPDMCKSLKRKATQAQLDRLEAQTGVRMTKDTKEFFLRHNGQAYEHSLIHVESEDEEFRIFSTAEAYNEWKMWKELDDIGEFAEADSSPDPGVRDCWWHAKWLPFAGNGAGDSLCFDFSPAKGGKKGQIITMWHERSDRAILSPSARHILADICEYWQNET